MYNPRIITIFALLFLLLASCDTVDPLESAELTEEQRAEAYRLALWYTGELQPSEADVQSAARTLSQIRTRYGNRSEFIRDSNFVTPWVPNRLNLMVTVETRAEYDAEGSWPWEADSDLPQPESYRTYNFSSVHVGLSFEEDLHPGRLCSLYLERGYVINCYPDYYGFIGLGRHGVIVEVISDQIRWFSFQSQNTFGPGSSEFHLIIESNGSLIYKENPDNFDFFEMNEAFSSWQIPQIGNDFEPHGGVEIPNADR